MKLLDKTTAVRLITSVLVVTLFATAAPAAAAIITDKPTSVTAAKFASLLAIRPQRASKIAQILTVVPRTTKARATEFVREPAPEPPAALTQAPVMAQAPVVSAAPKPASTTGGAGAPTKRSSQTGGSELAQAKAILASLVAQHPILKGTTVTIGSTPNNYQAVAYYQSGRIVINPNHRASLSRILNHEVWHVIDWRDNGRIDWGENIPPK